MKNRATQEHAHHGGGGAEGGSSTEGKVEKVELAIAEVETKLGEQEKRIHVTETEIDAGHDDKRRQDKLANAVVYRL